MPKAPILNQPFVYRKLLTYLSQSGPLKTKDLCAFLHISQPTCSRLMAQGQDAILRIGRGPKTVYACRRSGTWNSSGIPVHSIDENGALSLAATLHPISPRGFYVESHTGTLTTKMYEHLPYFFEDLRPSGFLGRLVPRMYPELGFPDDISLWTDDHCLVYLTRCGWDLMGNFMMGEKSENEYRVRRQERFGVIDSSARQERYPQLAKLVLSQGIPGSSAAGEQPKFFSLLQTKTGLQPVMVKFSPPLGDAVSQRIADLLVCEHIAHDVLRKHGKSAPRSCLIKGNNQLFLEMERFDRNRSGGRFGIISLRALDLEFVGQLNSWSETAQLLAKKKIIDQATALNIVWLDVFGRLIGNSDRHHGNISFFCTGEKITGLAPVYDMLPMMYAPQHHQLVNRHFNPDPPKANETAVWSDALSTARSFWIQVQQHAMISDSLKKEISNNASILQE